MELDLEVNFKFELTLHSVNLGLLSRRWIMNDKVCSTTMAEIMLVGINLTTALVPRAAHRIGKRLPDEVSSSCISITLEMYEVKQY